MAKKISGSVGKGGKNQSADVRVVQELLNANISKLAPLALLVVDEQVGSKTIGAIEKFQRNVVGMKNPDGRVDPVGRTASALNSKPRTTKAPPGPNLTSKSQLNSWLNKGMADICLNGFGDRSKNHCAHFVSHVLNLNFGYTCKSHTSGKQPGGNLRVHEIFSRCANTSEIIQSSTSAYGIIFVSGKNNFVTRGGVTTLRNIPRKHVGLLIGNSVWHYSNTKNKVVQQIMAQFLHHYRGQENALWLGTFPAGARAIWYGQC